MYTEKDLIEFGNYVADSEYYNNTIEDLFNKWKVRRITKKTKEFVKGIDDFNWENESLNG